MQVVRDDIWLCCDCMFAAVNGDAPESEEQDKATTAGLERLGRHLVPDFQGEWEDGHVEFTWRSCECCNSRLGGSRWRFAVLGA